VEFHAHIAAAWDLLADRHTTAGFGRLRVFGGELLKVCGRPPPDVSALEPHGFAHVNPKNA